MLLPEQAAGQSDRDACSCSNIAPRRSLFGSAIPPTPMKFVVLVLSLLAVVAGTASAAIFTQSPEARTPGTKPAKISGLLQPAAALAIDTGRSPVPSLRLPKAAPRNATLTEPPAQLPPPRRLSDSSAKAAIERDGYKGVRGLTCNEGRCTGRALRGETEISITVEPDGTVRSN